MDFKLGKIPKVKLHILAGGFPLPALQWSEELAASQSEGAHAVFRFNRRKSRHAAFETLLGVAAGQWDKRDKQHSEIDNDFQVTKQTPFDNMWRFYTEKSVSVDQLKTYNPKGDITTRFKDLSKAAKLIDKFNYIEQ